MRTHQPGQYVVITGAERGLGRAFAQEFASRGYNLILQGNGDEGFASFPNELASKYGIAAISSSSDFKEERNVYGFVDWVSSLALPLAGLVIFSGGKGKGKFEAIEIDHLENVLLVNLRAMTLLNRLFLIEFKKYPSSFILNISNPENHKKEGQLIYTASNVFIYSLTVGLGEEFKKTSTQVSLLLPALLDVGRENGESLHGLRFWRRLGIMKPEELAEISVNELLAGRKVIQPGFFLKMKLRVSKAIQKIWASPSSPKDGEEKIVVGGELVEKEQENL